MSDAFPPVAVVAGTRQQYVIFESSSASGQREITVSSRAFR